MNFLQFFRTFRKPFKAGRHQVRANFLQPLLGLKSIVFGLVFSVIFLAMTPVCYINAARQMISDDYSIYNNLVYRFPKLEKLFLIISLIILALGIVIGRIFGILCATAYILLGITQIISTPVRLLTRTIVTLWKGGYQMIEDNPKIQMHACSSSPDLKEREKERERESGIKEITVRLTKGQLTRFTLKSSNIEDRATEIFDQMSASLAKPQL